MAGKGYTRKDGVKVKASAKWTGGRASVAKAVALTVAKTVARSRPQPSAARAATLTYLKAVRRADVIRDRGNTSQDLLDELREENFGVKFKPGRFIGSFDGLTSTDFTSYSGGRAVGILSLRHARNSKRVEMINSMTTAKRYQGKGITTEMFDHARSKGYVFPPSAFGRKRKVRGEDVTEYTEEGRKFIRKYVQKRAEQMSRELDLFG